MVKAGVIRKIKRAKNYTYAELARVTGKSEATIRNWSKDDMRVLKNGTPHIVLGSDARDYLLKKFHTNKSKLRIGQIRCFTCQAKKMLEIGVAEILPKTPSGWQLRGLCECCGNLGSRWVAERDIPLHAKKLDIEFNTESQAYSGSPFPIQTSNTEGQDTHA